MKSAILLLVLIFFSIAAKCQKPINDSTGIESCVTLGILNGGGSLIGVDAEILFAKRVGLQVGAGFLGYGGAINYHLKPGIRTSFLSLTYWHQGIGNSYSQSVIGPSFVYRSKKWFTAQLGIGARIGKGPSLDEKTYNQTPVILLYSIGAYIAQ